MSEYSEEIFHIVKWEIENFDGTSTERFVPHNELKIHTEEGKDPVAFFLQFHPIGNRDPKKVGISIGIDADTEVGYYNRIRCKLGIHHDISTRSVTKTFEADVKNVSAAGFDFMPRAELLNPVNGYIVEGMLTVKCEVTLFHAEGQSLADVKNVRHSSGISDFKKMFEEGKLADFLIRTKDGKILRAHKVVLAARSPVFYKMITAGLKPSRDNVARVADFDSAVMKEALRFIYCCEVENLSEIVYDLHRAAGTYDLQSLKQLCVDFIYDNMKPSNVAKALAWIVNKAGTEKIFDRAVNLAISDFEGVSHSEQWKSLSARDVTRITSKMMKRTPFVYHSLRTWSESDHNASGAETFKMFTKLTEKIEDIIDGLIEESEK